MKSMKLGEIIEIKHGYAFSGDYIITNDNGIVLVTPGNFKIGGGFKEEKCKFYEGEIIEEYVLKPGDYIVTMTDLSKTIDTLGYSAKVPNNTQRIYLHNQRIGLIRFKRSDVYNDYIYYLMQTSDYQKSIANTSSGAVVHHTSPSRICDYNVVLPDYNTQKKIAIFLSTLDAAIENNQKQIKLLEEAAQRLYKEWFVDLHFPGWKNTEIVDRVPNGWSFRKISDFGEVITGKTPSTEKSENYGGEIPFVKIPDMHGCVYPIKTEITLSEIGANSQKNKFIPPNSVMVSCIATVGLVNISIADCQTNQQINSIVLRDSNDLYFLYCSMKRIKLLLEGVGSNGATMTNVNKTKFSELNVLYPTLELKNRFYNYCEPMFEKIKTLSIENTKLQESRDCLLPRLMSGELEV